MHSARRCCWKVKIIERLWHLISLGLNEWFGVYDRVLD
jgi:hypothetical protein